MFPYERLEVYRKSIQLVKDVELLLPSLKRRVSYPFIDQLTRAALSVPLNIAEGNGRWHKGDKSHFFQISRGSAFEVMAILEIVSQKEIVSPEEYQRFYKDIETISKMLTALVASLDRSESSIGK